MLTAGIVLASALVFAVVLAARELDGRAWRRSLRAIELRMPLGLTTKDINQWLNTVAAGTHAPKFSLLAHPPLALEIVADVSGIRHMLLVPKQLRVTVLSGLRAALPGVRVQDDDEYLRERPLWTVGAETMLSTQQRRLSLDRAEGTATAVLATLQPLGDDERIVVQWIITGAGTPEPVQSARPADLPDWFSTEDLRDGEAVRTARLKQTDAMLHGVMRIGVSAATAAQSQAIVGRVLGQYRGLNAPGVRLLHRWSVPSSWAASRMTDLRLPVVNWPLRLSTRETAGLLPIPLGDVALPGLALGMARQLPPPSGLAATGVQIGRSNYPDMPVPLHLGDIDRLQHLHVVGPTGVGKSTLLATLILQDIAAGHGVIVIDPKSDLVGAVLDRIPEHRTGDVIVLDPASVERPVGFNLLQSAHDEQSRELIVDHVIHIWHELYEDSWGPRSEDVLRGALLSLINTKGANGEAFTLIEAPNLLTENPFRKFVTEQDTVPAGLGSFWAWYKGILPAERLKVVGPILNKLRASTLRTPIRLMLGQSNGIDLGRVLAERRVLLVPLSAGTLGSETASLLGTILLAGIWFAIMQRVTLPASERHPIYIYVDEAQSVLKLPVDLADMLAMARGLGAGFTLAHQFLGQVEDKLVRAALLGSVRSQIVFQCLRDDADELAKSYQPWLTTADLMGLDRYEAAARTIVDSQPLAPFTFTTAPLPPPLRDGAALADASRLQLGRPRAEVEAALAARIAVGEPERKPRSKQSSTPDGPLTPPKQQPFGRRRKSASDAETTT